MEYEVSLLAWNGIAFPFCNAVKIDYDHHGMEARTKEYDQRICRAPHLFDGADGVAVTVNSREIVTVFCSGYLAAIVIALQPGKIFTMILTGAVFLAVGALEIGNTDIGNGVQYACRIISTVRSVGIFKICIVAMRYGQVAQSSGVRQAVLVWSVPPYFSDRCYSQ